VSYRMHRVFSIFMWHNYQNGHLFMCKMYSLQTSGVTMLSAALSTHKIFFEELKMKKIPFPA